MKKSVLISSLMVLALLSSACRKEHNVYGPGGDPLLVQAGAQDARLLQVGERILTADYNGDIKSWGVSNPAEPQLLNQEFTRFYRGVYHWQALSDSLFFTQRENLFLVFKLLGNGDPEEWISYNDRSRCDRAAGSGTTIFLATRKGCDNQFHQQDSSEIHLLELPWRPLNPVRGPRFPMEDPSDLVLFGQSLVVADQGIKILDVSDTTNIQMVNHYPDIEAERLYAFDDLLLVQTANGLSQYRFQANNLHFLNHLK